MAAPETLNSLLSFRPNSQLYFICSTNIYSESASSVSSSWRPHANTTTDPRHSCPLLTILPRTHGRSPPEKFVTEVSSSQWSVSHKRPDALICEMWPSINLLSVTMSANPLSLWSRMKALINHGSDCGVSGSIGRGREEDGDADDDEDDGGGGGGQTHAEVGQVQSEWTCEWHRRVMWPVSWTEGGGALVLSVSGRYRTPVATGQTNQRKSEWRWLRSLLLPTSPRSTPTPGRCRAAAVALWH